jgi:hypothetical protein
VSTPAAPSRIPEFATYEEEASFWDDHSTEEFADEWEPVEWVVGEVSSHFIVRTEFDRPTWELMRALARQRGVRLSDLARAWILEGFERDGGQSAGAASPTSESETGAAS